MKFITVLRNLGYNLKWIFVCCLGIAISLPNYAQVRDNEVKGALQIIKQALQSVDDPRSNNAAVGGNSALLAVIATGQGESLFVRLEFSSPPRYPESFFISNPPRLVLDMPGVNNATGKTSQVANQGALRNINIAQGDRRTRVILNLSKVQDYTMRIEGNVITVAMTPGQGEDLSRSRNTSAFTEQSGSSGGGSLKSLNFARSPDGAGKILVELSDSGVVGDIKRTGNNLQLDFPGVGLPEKLRRTLDVSSFGTPVVTVSAAPLGSGTRVIIKPTGSWEHVAYQAGDKYTVEVRSVNNDPNRIAQTVAGKTIYRGPKVSVNFQNGDIRGILRLMSEELGLNAVISENVQGLITITLQNVPADQVIDIILQQKSLVLRKNDNVLLIGTNEEFSQRDKSQADSSKIQESVEPIRAENFQINYHIADDVRTLISTAVSPRGSAAVDKRNNILFVQDTETNLQKIRTMISKVDIPVRQVMIEARIVEANDNFNKVIGSRLGINDQSTKQKGYMLGGTQDANHYLTGQTPIDPGISKTNLINLPGTASAGQAGSVALTLFNSGMTRFLNMELTALENDGRGKIVSSPRVMTSNQVEAIIEQGTNIPYQSASSSGATSTSFQKANLILRVKPQITPDGRILMDLDINKDSPSTSVTTSAGVAVDTKHIKTNVLVDNGGTVVIGGIFTELEKNTVNKVPVFGDLPLVGFLFRQKETVNNKTEMLVFITPRIVEDTVNLR